MQFFSAEKQSIDIFSEKNSRFRDASKTNNIFDASLFAFVDGVGSILIGVLLWYATGHLDTLGFHIGDVSVLTAGVMVAYIDYLNRLLGLVVTFLQRLPITNKLAALVKIFHLVDSCEPRKNDGVKLVNVKGELLLQDVGFRYSEDGKDILQNISLHVQSGEVVAVVGSSGSGKTTLTRILDGSYTGYTGSIQLDGVELSTVSISSLHRVYFICPTGYSVVFSK